MSSNSSLADWTVARIGDLSGKTALVTGANSGLGLVVSRLLAEAGARVMMAGRNQGRLDTAMASVKGAVPLANLATTLVDVSLLESVQSAADGLIGELEGLDLLVNNAGIMATPRSVTADGFENQFATNHLGHFALSGRLLPLLEAVNGRVVAVSSIAAQKGSIRFEDIHHATAYDPWTVYRQTKLANLMFGREFAKRATAKGSGVTATIAHPGVSSTNLGSGLNEGGIFQKIQSVMFSLGGQSPELGALPIVCAAVGPVESGAFVGPDGFKEFRGSGVAASVVPSAAKDEAASARLWELSEELTDVHYL